jgi:hypothetical protein
VVFVVLFVIMRKIMPCLYHVAIKNTSTHPHIDWDQVVRAEVNADCMLHDNSFPLRVDLPSIVSSSSSAVQRRTPFQVAPQTVTAVVHCASLTATVSVCCHQFLCQPFFLIEEENENTLLVRTHARAHTHRGTGTQA